MKTLILAAGRSKRVKPIEDKNFLKFSGKTLIERQIEMLKAAGFTDLILVGGAHNLDRLKEVAKRCGVVLVEQKNLDEGMAGAILSAEQELGNEPLVVFSSNDVLDQTAFEKIKAASTGSADAYLLAYEVKHYFPGGYLKTKGKRITGIVEKPEPGTQPSNWINLVLHLHKHPEKLIETLKKTSSNKDDLYELALATLMQKMNFEAVPYEGFWQALKFPWHVLDLMNAQLKHLKKSIHPSVQIAPTATINGEVVLEEGVKVMDNAVIQGPVYIGKNTTIATNALVRESMVGESCVIGFSTEIARSFIGDHTWFHSNYTGDSVIGDNCSFGAGGVCANLRLDEKEISSAGQNSGRNKLGPILGNDIRVGVNTSLMPGVRIGSNSMIGSGLVIAQDIDANSFVTGKMELSIKENHAKVLRRPF